MKNKLFYMNLKEAEFLRSVISYHLKNIDLPARNTNGRKVLRNVLKRLHKFVMDSRKLNKLAIQKSSGSKR